MRMSARLLIICLVVGCVTLAVQAAEEKKTDDSEILVVKVNDTVIKEKDVAAETEKRLTAQAQRMPPGKEINDRMRNQIRTGVVDMLVEKTLLEQKLASQKVTIADKQSMEDIEKIAKQQNLTMEDVPAEIAKFGMTMDDLKGQILMKLQMDTLIEKEMKEKDITDEDIKTFYDKNPQYFERAEEVQASHILVKLEENATPEQKAEARKKIEELQKKVKDGGDFAELAKANSNCPSSERGGDLGSFGRGQMVPEFENAAFTMEVGQVSDIIETRFGYHLIKKTGHTKAEKTDLDEVKDQIKQYLTQQKRSEFWEGYSKKMRDEAKIEYSEAETKLREETTRPPVMPQAQPR